MQPTISHDLQKRKEFVVVGLSISESLNSTNEVVNESVMYIGKYNKPISFYEHFLAAVRYF